MKIAFTLKHMVEWICASKVPGLLEKQTEQNVLRRMYKARNERLAADRLERQDWFVEAMGEAAEVETECAKLEVECSVMRDAAEKHIAEELR